MSRISIDEWPRNLTIAVAILKQNIEDLENGKSVFLEESSDDLDHFKAAVVCANGAVFGLKQYRGTPFPGAEVWVTEGDATHLVSELDKALTALGLDRKAIAWHREDLHIDGAILTP